jgi:hypothetical protein
VDAAIDELEVFQEQVDFHQLLLMEEICQFCHAVKWKDEIENSCCRYMILLKSLNSYLKIIVFGQSQILQEHLWSYVHGCIAHRKCPDCENLVNALESVYMFRAQETIFHCVGTLLPIESRTTSPAQSYSGMEAQVNMRYCVMDGLDGEIVATVQHVLSQVNSFVEICELENI